MKGQIRPYQDDDMDRIKEITCEVFGPSAVDFYIEQTFGKIGGHDWQWRKARHLDDDLMVNPEGIFVYEAIGSKGNRVLGYVTVILDRGGRIGRIPNLAVARDAQNMGLGRKLISHATQYVMKEGMEYLKIETLVGNAVGEHLYPALGFQEVARQIHYVKKLQ